MKAIVHIGMMKTGSTSIQRWLRSNRVALVEEGAHTLHGPVKPALPLFQAIFQIAVYEMGVDEESAWIGPKRKFEKDVAKHEACKMMTREIEKLSGESGIFLHCCELIYECNETHMVALDRYLSRFFDEITYVIYIRNTVDFFVSLYSQKIDNNLSYESGTYEFSEFLKKCGSKLIPYGLESSFGNLFAWQGVVGNRLNVRLLESDWLTKGDLIEDFASLAGVATLDKPLRKNESIAAEYIEYVRFLNREFRDNLPRDTRSKIIEILRQESIGKPKLAASDAQAKSIRDIHREEEERIKNEFFPDRPFLFSPRAYGNGVAPEPLTDCKKAEIEMEIREKMAPEVWVPVDFVCAANNSQAGSSFPPPVTFRTAVQTVPAHTPSERSDLGDQPQSEPEASRT